MVFFTRRKDAEQPRRSAWWVTFAGLIGAVLFIVSYSAYWFLMANQLRSAVDSWRNEFRAAGGVADWRQLDIYGFPFWLYADVTALRLGRPVVADPWFWEVSRAAATLRPWNFHHLSLDLAGEHAFQFTAEGRALPLEGAAITLDIDLERLTENTWQANAGIEGISLIGPVDIGNISISGAKATVRRLHPIKNHLLPTWELELSGRGIALPVSFDLPLGRDVARLTLDARLLGQLQPGLLVDILPKWRDAGGTVEIGHMEMEWGPLLVRGDGTIALDASLQPIGAFIANAQGFFEVLEGFRRQGIIDNRDAMTASIVLGMLSRRPTAGGVSTISIPLSVQLQTLYAGPLSVAKLPEVRWTGAMPSY
jgi:hypothetical protein